MPKLSGQTKPNGRGKGKWQNYSTLDAYRVKRNARNRTAEASRKRNR